MTAIERVGLVLLFAAVLLGVWRTADGFSPQESGVPTVTDYAPGSLPGAEVLASAIRTDLLAAELRSKPPARTPFRSVPRAAQATTRSTSAPATKRSASPPAVSRPRESRSSTVPRVMLVIRDESGPRVVLSLGENKSGPLSAGEDFSHWKVREIGVEKVYLEKSGIRLTLPIP